MRSEWIGPKVNCKLDSFLRICNSAKRWMYLKKKKKKQSSRAMARYFRQIDWTPGVDTWRETAWVSIYFPASSQAFLLPSCTFDLGFHMSFYILFKKTLLFKFNQVGIKYFRQRALTYKISQMLNWSSFLKHTIIHFPLLCLFFTQAPSSDLEFSYSRERGHVHLSLTSWSPV